jgi:RNA polymerase sigma factor (sigma-70 family)
MGATAVHVRSPGPARARRLPRVGDDRLVARVRAGDDTAFEIIYDRYYRGLLAFCGQMLGSRQEAEDALQHSFASAYRALRAGVGDIELRPWLYTIARNRCVSVHRAQRVQVSADGLAADFGSFEGMSAQVQLRADLRELVDELQRLPDDQRAALVLFELGDESHAQIAAVLGVRREKVKALVFQAREALMRARDARATPCVEIREELSTVVGRVPRRSVARRHIDRCPGCAEFEREVRRQRAAFAAILPLAPTVGLKASVLGFAVGGGGGAVALGGAGAGGGATVAASGALAAGGMSAVGSGIAGSAGAATAGAIGTAGAATVATGLATGGGAGLASLPTKVVVAKILSVVALGGGVQSQVHSDPPTRPAAIHQSALRPVAPARVPSYPPSPERRVPAKAPAIQATASAGSPAAAPQAAAAPPASAPQPPAASHAPAAPAPSTTASSAPSSSATPAAAAATPAASDPSATTAAPVNPAPSNPPVGGTAPPAPISSTATGAPAPVAAPAPDPAPVPSDPPAPAPPTDGGTGTIGTAAPAAATASAAVVAAS